MTEHLHIWTVPDEHGTWTCATCPETSPTCIVHRPSDEPDEGHPTGTSLPICARCLEQEQQLLTDIVTARDRIAHDPPSPVRAIAYDPTNVGGSPSEATIPHDLGRDIDDWYYQARGVRSPAGVDDVLTEWADAWAEKSGDPGASTTAPANYLSAHLIWAANHPGPAAWDDYRTEMRELLHTAQAFDPYRPQRTGESCIECGGHLVREWRRDGLGDDITCETCGMHYSDAAYRMAARIRLADAARLDPDTLVTVKDAEAALPDARPGTLRVWAHRAKRDHAEGTTTAPVPMRGKDRSGRPLFRLGDLRDALGVSMVAPRDRVS
ncbi:hypothetical protein SAMN05216184_104115 [Georgenia satyanarayanai]|uniref:GATA-type domain-containing protein n=1 Tax=Georgenia satyanarayanai TaxID=860221 RepID=A0A2Y9A883_9MICO|nr:hypothetical protein [Georgenia satyanarayanai]PYG00176.1 hypothetical protein A8987_104115 [Georgenia satyanarayanai]SSA40405.1 hypothetical protein SAMN05216184_104115 [Georgenia satyanarayanai]